MITNAIQALGARSGSSRPAILKYILDNNKIADAENAGVRMKLAIRKMQAAKTLVPVKGSYKMSEQKTKPKKKTPKKKRTKKAAKKPAAKKSPKKAAKKPAAKKPAAKKPAARKTAKKPAKK